MGATYNWNPQMVWVTNTGKGPFRDKFDGQDFFFPMGKKVKCHRIAANHFFACDARDRLEAARQHPEHQAELRAAESWWDLERSRVLTRNRWNVKADGTRANDPDATLNLFKIEPVVEETAQGLAEAEPSAQVVA